MISAWLVLGTRLGTPGTNLVETQGDAQIDVLSMIDWERCSR
jgi:hypothetical protein